MSKVTSKLQVTLPKAIADRYGVAPGAELLFEPAGDSIRVLIAREPGLVPAGLSLDDRRALFEAATRRQAVRNRRHAQAPSLSKRKISPTVSGGRGWTREELYDRDRTR